MKATIKHRMPHKKLKEFSEILGVSENNLSQILGGHRGISKKRSIRFSNIMKKHGYDLPPEMWMFSPEKIKQIVSEEKA